jgi:integrase
MRRRKQRSRGQGSLKKRTKHGPYIARWIDHEGRRRERSTRTTDRAAAERILAKLIADVALRRDGVIDPHLDATLNETRRDIADHIADFEARLIAAHRKPKHVAQTIRYIRTIVDAKGWTCAADINADGVNGFAADLRTLGERGRSARTIQAHLTAIKGFTKWLSAHHKLPRDPLVSVTKPNPKVDRRRARRMLLPEEWEWLRAKLVTAAERYRVPAQERMLLYATAIQTGLRAGELRGLKRGQLFLDGDQPYITCKAGQTKNAKDARQYIRSELAAAIQTHVATKLPTAPVFAMPPAEDLADMLRGDLRDARGEWLDAAKHDPKEHRKRLQSDFLCAQSHDGERLDFHSLRHTCGAWLTLTGAHPKAVQAVMRHSSITLTMDTYGHLFPGQEAETVGRLPDMVGNNEEVLAATGTSDAVAQTQETGPHLKCHQLERDSLRHVATGCNENTGLAEDAANRNPLQGAEIREAAPDGATKCETGPPGTRTPDPLIKSQLLCQLS